MLNSRQRRKREAERHNSAYEESKLPPRPKTEEELTEEKRKRHKARILIAGAAGLSVGGFSN